MILFWANKALEATRDSVLGLSIRFRVVACACFRVPQFVRERLPFFEVVLPRQAQLRKKGDGGGGVPRTAALSWAIIGPPLAGLRKGEQGGCI
jgi:hypothetical protein